MFIVCLQPLPRMAWISFLSYFADAPSTGYTNLSGKFVKVKQLEAELIVPDLTGFEVSK